jgi:hypothetical protein
MYDEFERALTGRSPRRGPTPLGWLAIGAGVFLVVGMVGVGYGITRAARGVRHAARHLAEASPAAVARAAARLEKSTSVVALDPSDGLRFLQGLDAGDPARALMERVVGPRLDLPDLPDQGATATSERGQDEVRSTTFHSDDGDVRIDVKRRRNGGSLVLDSKDGHVRFNLVKSHDGGGSLTIDSDDGHARIDLVRSDDGGRLVIHGDDESVELAVGSSGRSAPSWVPRPDGMPANPRPVFSLSTRGNLLGAVTWDSDASPGDLVASYRGSLEKAGYDVDVEHSESGPDGEQASLWARRDRDGRTVFVLARRRDGRTHEVLGYGEDDAGDR